MVAPKKYPDELRVRAVRLWRESEPKPVIRRLAEQLNVRHEALRNWICQDEADRGERDDRPSSDMLAENRRLLKENTSCVGSTRSSRRPVRFSPRSAIRPGGGHEVHRRTP